MKQFSAKILRNKSVCRSMYEIDFEWNNEGDTPEAGQFFTIRIGDSTVPLLRRPFAFSGYDQVKKSVSSLYQVRGPATRLLSALPAGESIDIIAPLGKCFSSSPAKKMVLVAGGIGVGPILFLYRTVAAQMSDVQMVFGCRSSGYLPEVVADDREIAVCSDDGSVGFKGTVTDYIEQTLGGQLTESVLYSCGPYPMLHACHLLAEKYSTECFVSVEQMMACGVGACMGCAVKVHKEPGFVRACKEGPVFSSRDIRWEQ